MTMVRCKRLRSSPLAVIVLLLFSFFSAGSSYQIGDAVDTDVVSNFRTEDALRNQMPVFGLPSTTMFHLPGVQQFSLRFEEGLRPLPTISTKALEKVEVTFVYSKSGDGTIHSVTSKASYSSRPHKKGFRVHYEWVEEEKVDIVAGAAVMFMATFLATVVILIQACSVIGLGESLEDEPHQYAAPIDYSSPYAYGVASGTAPGQSKWD